MSNGKLLTPGECDFEVRKATEEVSKSGKDMIKLVLEVYDSAGESAIVFDYLLDAMPHKVRHFCYGTGMGRVYEAGTLDAAQCEGKSGRVLIRNEQDRMKQYPPKNAVADYVVADRTKGTKNYQDAKDGKPRVGDAIGSDRKFTEQEIPF